MCTCYLLQHLYIASRHIQITVYVTPFSSLCSRFFEHMFSIHKASQSISSVKEMTIPFSHGIQKKRKKLKNDRKYHGLAFSKFLLRVRQPKGLITGTGIASTILGRSLVVHSSRHPRRERLRPRPPCLPDDRCINVMATSLRISLH